LKDSEDVEKETLSPKTLVSDQGSINANNKTSSGNNLIHFPQKIRRNPNKESVWDRKKKKKTGGHVARNFKVILQSMLIIFENRKSKVHAEEEKKKLKQLLNGAVIAPSDFQKVQMFLKKFLSEKKLTEEDLLMSDIEIILFALFIVKKKFSGLRNLEWNPENLQNLRYQKTKKTSEQNYKIIFKKFFKLIIRDFNKNQGLPSSEDLEFYKFNFETLASSMGEDWRKLQFKFVFNEDRAKSIPKSGRQSKKIFAKVLQKSPIFMKQMQEYLENKLVLGAKTHGVHTDYWPIIESKLEQMVDRWTEKFKSKKNIKSRLCNFLVAQMKNDKIKLPWGYGEINQAISNVNKLFNRVK
jgi:hypothetical protein